MAGLRNPRAQVLNRPSPQDEWGYEDPQRAIFAGEEQPAPAPEQPDYGFTGDDFRGDFNRLIGSIAPIEQKNRNRDSLNATLAPLRQYYDFDATGEDTIRYGGREFDVLKSPENGGGWWFSDTANEQRPGMAAPTAFGPGNGADTGIKTLEQMFASLSPLQSAFEEQLTKNIKGSKDGRPFESIREEIDRGRKASLSQMRAELANRGLLSEPGHAQGPEISGTFRTEEAIAPVFAGALRDAALQSERQNMEMASTYVGGQNRLRAEIALTTLDQNRKWNEFLASYGLQRDELLHQMEMGNAAFVQSVIDNYRDFIGLGAQGQED